MKFLRPIVTHFSVKCPPAWMRKCRKMQDHNHWHGTPHGTKLTPPSGKGGKISATNARLTTQNGGGTRGKNILKNRVKEV